MRPMLPSERLVGRRMPPRRPHIDALMASFVKADGTFAARMNPDESWLKPAHLKARRKGWLRSCRLTIRMQGERGPGMSLWELTEAGQIEAVEAKARHVAAEEARNQWSRDHQAAHIAAVKARRETQS